VQQIDILPTIFDFLGLPCPPGVQGKSIRQCLTEDKPINKYVLSMIGYDPRLRMIRYHGLKYWIIGTEEQCFDLRADPQENHQITNQQVLQELRFILLQALIDAEDPLPHPA
jgi:arylsulfatase A-like enzyme